MVKLKEISNSFLFLTPAFLYFHILLKNVRNPKVIVSTDYYHPIPSGLHHDIRHTQPCTRVQTPAVFRDQNYPQPRGWIFNLLNSRWWTARSCLPAGRVERVSWKYAFLAHLIFVDPHNLCCNARDWQKLTIRVTNWPSRWQIHQ